jgi:hypothetical protein
VQACGNDEPSRTDSGDQGPIAAARSGTSVQSRCLPRPSALTDPRCPTSRRHRRGSCSPCGEASPSVCAISLGSSRKTGGSLNAGKLGGEARLPGLIQTSSPEESDDKASAGSGGGLARNKSVNAGTVFASAHRAMPSVHTKCFSFRARLILTATSSKDIGPMILPLSP